MKRTFIADIVGEQNIVALKPTAFAQDAAQAMSAHSIAAIAVTNDEGHLIGIVSERDLTHRVLAGGLNPQTTPISDVMTENPETLRPDDSVLDAAELMLGRKIRHLPIVTSDGKMVAMVSMHDLLKATLSALNADMDAARDAAFAPEDA